MLSYLLICKLKSSLKGKHNSKHKCESVGSYYPTHRPEWEREIGRQRRYQLEKKKKKPKIESSILVYEDANHIFKKELTWISCTSSSS